MPHAVLFVVIFQVYAHYFILRQALFDIRVGNSNLAKSLVEKVIMQCTKIKTHKDVCYLYKINKTNHFSLILVTSIHKTDFFLIVEIYMGFPYIPEAVSSFLPKCLETSSFFTY